MPLHATALREVRCHRTAGHASGSVQADDLDPEGIELGLEDDLPQEDDTPKPSAYGTQVVLHVAG